MTTACHTPQPGLSSKKAPKAATDDRFLQSQTGSWSSVCPSGTRHALHLCLAHPPPGAFNSHICISV